MEYTRNARVMGTRYSFLLFLLAIAGHCLLFGVSTAQAPTAGLVAFWPFNGNANDASGNGLNGTSVPAPDDFGMTAPTSSVDRFGFANRAFLFNGGRDGIRVPHNALLNLPTDFTISGWFRTCAGDSAKVSVSGSHANEHAPITLKSHQLRTGSPNPQSGEAGYFLGFQSPTAQVPHRVNANPETHAGGGRPYNKFECGPVSILTDNQWHHVVWVCNPSNRTSTVFIDDGLFTCTVPDSTLYDRSSNTQDLYIGHGDRAIRSPSFIGALDDIRIYNRALTRAEVTALYTEGGWPATAASRDLGLIVRPLGDTVICRGDSLRLDLSHLGNRVVWDTYDGVEEPFSTRPVLSPEKTTTYEITALKVLAEGTCADTAKESKTITVVVRDAPEADNVALYPCSGDTVNARPTVSGGSPPYRFRWIAPFDLDDPSAEQQRFVADTSLSMSVIVTDAIGCSDTARVTVTVSPTPEVDVFDVASGRSLDTIFFCRGSERLALDARSPQDGPSAVYTWSDASSLDRADSSFVTSLPSDTARLIVDLFVGNCHGYDTVVIIPVDPPVAEAGEDGRICVGGSLLLGTDDDGTAEHLAYRWSPVAGLDDPTLRRPTASPATTRVYRLTVTDTITGCSSTDSVEIVVDDIRLSLASSSIDFGTLDGCTSDTTLAVVVENLGTTDARFAGATATDAFVDATGGVVRAGRSSSIDVRFSPGVAGSYSGEIVLVFGPCDDTLRLSYSGRKAESSLSIAPGRLDFGSVADCNVGPVFDTVTITNNGTDPARLDPASIDAPWRIVEPALPTTVDAGNELRVVVAYEPAGVGSFSSRLTLPFLSGSCSGELAVTLEGEVYEPALTVVSDTLDFGLLDGCATETTGSVQIENPGDSTIELVEVLLPDGVTATSVPSGVDAGSSGSIDLRFAPATTGSLDELALIVFGPCPDTLEVRLIGQKTGVSFAIADTIDFGEVCVGKNGSAEIAIGLDAQGAGDGEVLDATVTGPFAGGPTAGDALPDGGTLRRAVSFAPSAAGPIEGTIQLRLDPCGVERTIVLRGTGVSVNLAAGNLDFGLQPSGSSTTRIVTWTNNGLTPVRITQLAQTGDVGTIFTAISTSPPLPVDLAPGQTLNVEVEYAAAQGESIGTLGVVIEGTCDTTVSIDVRGTGEIAARATVTVADITAEPGERRAIELMLSDDVGLEAAGITSFTAVVSVEASLLVVDDPTPWQLIGDRRHIEITGRVNPGSPILASIPSTVLLGRVESSALVIEEFTFDNSTGPVEITTVDGTLTLDGLCREGGTRLIDPDGELAIKHVIPSPVLGSMSIDYSLLESGQHALSIYDAGGREVAPVFSGLMVPGTYRVEIGTNGLAAGVYHLVLQSPTLVVTRHVVVVR